MSTILGLHLGHDGSACVVQNGRLISALSSERLSRQKKSHGVTNELIDAVLGRTHIHASEIDVIALSDYHSAYVHGTMEVRHNGKPEIVPDTWNRLFGNETYLLDVRFRGRNIPGYNIGHHMSHCAAAFYTSPFQSAFCMSMDSSGGWTKSNFGMAIGEGTKLVAVDGLSCLIGVAYGEVTERLHLGSQMFKAGSTMALAGYGQILPRVITEIEKFCAGSLFEHPHGNYRGWVSSVWDDLSEGINFRPEEKDSQRAMNVAASIQFIFEKAILHTLAKMKPNGVDNLCLGGGSFLNCNANSTVLRESGFKNLHLFPACSDDGCAIGAALYTAFNLLGETQRPKYAPEELCYLGPDRAEIEVDYTAVVNHLVNGAIVAWVEGRSEYGPRALGHRSLLADPRIYGNRERINFQIKDREWFRPLSPSVLAEDSQTWFDFPVPSPFMLFTARAKQPNEISAAVHIDGTARMQTVTESSNPHYYRLIKEFKSRTGIPMLLNTSLNASDEPVVESTSDAQRLWERKPIDVMVLDGMIHKR